MVWWVQHKPFDCAIFCANTLDKDTLKDPQIDRTKLRNLTDILMLSVLVAIYSTDSFVAIARFGQLNEEWLRTLATN